MQSIKIFKFYSQKWGWEALQKQRLKIATLDDLNDPFEFAAVSYQDKKLRQAFKKTREELFKDKGIICFSKSWANPVLWSHYAEGHRGMALEIEVPREILTDVSYITERYAADMTPESIERVRTEEFQKLLLSTKFKHWEYESEARVFCKLEQKDGEKQLYFRDLDDEIRLRSVILGALYTPQKSTTLNDEMASRGVSIKTSRLAFTTFSVMPQGDKKLWKTL